MAKKKITKKEVMLEEDPRELVNEIDRLERIIENLRSNEKRTWFETEIKSVIYEMFTENKSYQSKTKIGERICLVKIISYTFPDFEGNPITHNHSYIFYNLKDGSFDTFTDELDLKNGLFENNYRLYKEPNSVNFMKE